MTEIGSTSRRYTWDELIQWIGEDTEVWVATHLERLS